MFKAKLKQYKQFFFVNLKQITYSDTKILTENCLYLYVLQYGFVVVWQ